MKEIVSRLEAWYAKNTPAKLALRPGATDRAIEAAFYGNDLQSIPRG